MVKVLNKTAHQRIYTLTNGATLRVPAHSTSEPFEDALVCPHIQGDVDSGVVTIISVTAEATDTTKTDKGGKK